MNLIILEKSITPAYQQLVDQISAQILSGQIQENYMLPSIRNVAHELRISVITVKKAWEELEKQGYIFTIIGKGCFVKKGHVDIPQERKESIIEDRLSDGLTYLKSANIKKEDIIEYIKKEYKD